MDDIGPRVLAQVSIGAQTEVLLETCERQRRTVGVEGVGVLLAVRAMKRPVNQEPMMNRRNLR